MVTFRAFSIRALLVPIGACCLASCAVQPGHLPSPSVEEELRPLTGSSRAAPPAEAPEPQEGAQKPGELTLTQSELKLKKPRARGPRFDLSAREVPVKTILLALAEKLEKNIVVDPAIDETATLELKNVTLEEALVHLLVPNGLVQQVEEGIIRVSREKMEVRLFHLNYVLSRREGRSGLASHPGLGAGETSSAVLSSEEANLWKEIEQGLRDLVHGATPGGGNKNASGPYFSIQQQAGIIQVSHYPHTLLKVARFLEEVEGSVQRQVFIQAKIIEVSLNEENQLGIDWAKVNPRASAPGRRPAPSTGVHDGRPEVVIEALSRQGQVRMLSSPKIATLNNQRALIKMATEAVYFRPQAVGGRTGYAAQPVTEGIVLDVVPQINPNGTIMMSINTSISERAGERVSPDGMSVVPVLDVRQSNNVVLAGNGQTIVIGGLMKKTQRAEEGSQPLFGGLFHSDREAEAKTELVILLTPEIMVGDAVDDRYDLEIERLQTLGVAESRRRTAFPVFKR